MHDPESRRPPSAGSAALLVVAAMTAPGCEPAPDPPDAPRGVVRSFLERLDRHDVEGALALLDDAFEFRSGDGGFTADREALPDMLTWDAAAGSDVEIRELTASGDTVRARLVERNRFTELLELEPWVVEATFVVRNGRIVEEIAREVEADGPSFSQRFRGALEPVQAWAADARPAEADAVFEDGRVVRYDGPTARRLLELIEAYLRTSGDDR